MQDLETLKMIIEVQGKGEKMLLSNLSLIHLYIYTYIIYIQSLTKL